MTRRVLHLIDTGGPGGAETVFLDVVSGLDASRWASLAVIPTLDWLHGALAGRGIEPVILGGSGSFDVRFLRALIGTARRHRAELIHTHLLGSAVYGGLAARALRIPAVSTFHGQVDIDEDEPFRAAKLRIVWRRNTRVVFVSEALRRFFLGSSGRPVAEEITRVVHNGLDLDAFEARRDPDIRATLGYGPEHTVIGAIGNVRPAKAYDMLLWAAARVHEERPEARFLIAGEGSGGPLEDLLDLRAALGLDDVVEFVGFREDVPGLFRALDVFVLSSTFEGFSLSTLQAVASGVPAVATRSGGPEEILEDGVSGILVEPDAPEALARGLVSVLDGALTGGVPPRLAERRRLADVDRFTTGAMVRAYEDLYEELLDGGAEKRPPAGRA